MANLHLTAGDEYRTTVGWYEEGFVDDQVWVQAMGTLHFLNEQRGTPKTENQWVLWRLLMLGAMDPKEKDCKWHAAQMAMRFAAAAVNRVQQEGVVTQTQVNLQVADIELQLTEVL